MKILTKICIWQGAMVFLFIMATASANATMFTVDALINSSSGGVGLNTGISLSIGELFTATTDPNDLWSAGLLPRWSNADGITGDLIATGSDESGQPAGTLIQANHAPLDLFGLIAPFGSLVGELSGTYFVLGTSFSGSAPATGTLNLFYWDINFSDNTEHIVVDIPMGGTPVPEPSTMFLFGSGLVGLTCYNYCRQKQTA